MPDIQLGPYPGGMDNRQPAHSLAPGYCQDAVNMDVDSSGRYRTRGGFAKLTAIEGTQGFVACRLGTYVVKAGIMYHVASDGAKTSVHIGLVGQVAFCYVSDWNQLYFCDQLTTHVMGSDCSIHKWGVEVPLAPVCYAVGGALPAGNYLVQVARLDDAGYEGGISPASSITLGDNAGIRVTLEGVSRVYITGANGTHPYCAGTATGSLDVMYPAQGAPAPVRFVKPPPCGQIIAYFAGRIYVVDGDTVWYSEGYKPHRFHVASGLWQFAKPVTMFAPVSDGIWMATDNETYFRAGKDPDDLGQWLPQYNYGAMAGNSSAQVPNDNDVVWGSPRGLMRGMEGGQSKNLMEDHVAIQPGNQAGLVIMEVDGQRIGIFSYAPSGAGLFQNKEWVSRL